MLRKGESGLLHASRAFKGNEGRDLVVSSCKGYWKY
jgi:hypothetical protein